MAENKEAYLTYSVLSQFSSRQRRSIVRMRVLRPSLISIALKRPNLEEVKIWLLRSLTACRTVCGSADLSFQHQSGITARSGQ